MARLFGTGASDGLITELLGNQNHLCRAGIRLDVSCVGVLRGAWHGLTLKLNANCLVEPQDYRGRTMVILMPKRALNPRSPSDKYFSTFHSTIPATTPTATTALLFSSPFCYEVFWRPHNRARCRASDRGTWNGSSSASIFLPYCLPPTHSPDTTGVLEMNAVSSSNQTLSSLSYASDQPPQFRTFHNRPLPPFSFPPNPTPSSTPKPPEKGLARAKWPRQALCSPSLHVRYRSDRG